MESQQDSTAVAPAPMKMKRSEVVPFLNRLATTDPVRAWELGVQFSIEDRLTDIVYLLGVLAVGMLITLVIVLQISYRV